MMTTRVSACSALALAVAAFSPLQAQDSRILSVTPDGVLTWTNSQPNAYCGLETCEDLEGGWDAAPPPYWNIAITNPLMSTALPVSEIEFATLFLRIASSTNPLPGGETHDVDADGIPVFVATDYIDLDQIDRISRFRSGIGHDYSDDFESCRSMKHYFMPKATVDWSTVAIRAPVAGTVSRLDAEWAGTQVRIQSGEFPAFYFILFHVHLTSDLSVGDSLEAGQILGTHIGDQTMSDIAVGVNTPTGWKLLSYFDVITDDLFATYQSRGLATRTDAVIPQEDRDAAPLACSGEEFADPGTLPNWVELD
jgi:hypothetical protein